MTRIQYESHAEQMEAHRRDFKELWLVVYRALIDSGYSHKKAMAEQRPVWEAFLKGELRHK